MASGAVNGGFLRIFHTRHPFDAIFQRRRGRGIGVWLSERE